MENTKDEHIKGEHIKDKHVIGHKHHLFPGPRMIKTAIAVFLCLFLGIPFGEDFAFDAAIAAIICLQPDTKSSLSSSLNRVLGTAIGGAFGLLMMLLIRLPGIYDAALLRYLIIAAGVIIVIYLSVLVRARQSACLAAIIYLIIVMLHVSDEDPVVYALIRIASTFSGVVVSLLVNMAVFRNRAPECGGGCDCESKK